MRILKRTKGPIKYLPPNTSNAKIPGNAKSQLNKSRLLLLYWAPCCSLVGHHARDPCHFHNHLPKLRIDAVSKVRIPLTL